jgi:asparagine synthase (glutamine-hydrolysing)
MCGIAGIVGPGARRSELLQAMADTLAHRGPDGSGVWADLEAGVGLAHRRLAIIELSPAGHQPMADAQGRYVISYNGEIYNHLALRAELERTGRGPAGGWRGHSDTETLLEAIAGWGLEGTLRRCAGMFAFAVWDRRERTLSLVRDRFGEKPLYYGCAGRDLLFGSELKALRAHPQARWEIDRDALRALLARTYVPAPLSIYRGVFKLPPGTILTVRPDGLAATLQAPAVDRAERDGLRLSRYWSYRKVVEQGLREPIDDEAQALEALDGALREAIGGQAIADVPVGAFLSGGIDSSTVVALYQQMSRQPVRTFTIGFAEAGFNEADHAARVARHLGTVHHELTVTPADALAVIPRLPTIYDEPFADSSQIPTFLVSQFARGQVTVALSGDGGDELFGGYNRHVLAPALWRRLSRVPAQVRAVAGPLARVPASWWGPLVRHGPREHKAQRIVKGLRVAGTARSADDVYLSFLDEWAFEPSPALAGKAAGFDLEVAGAPDALRMMYCDAVSYLPDDILCKVDRAAMAVSLETRLPFLDHRVAAVAARAPLQMKVRGNRGKLILRKLLARHLPPELFERPKAGFAVPVGDWLRGPLRPWAEALLSPRRLAEEGWFAPAPIIRRWQDHLSGRRDSTAALWAVLMFQAWQGEQKG